MSIVIDESVTSLSKRVVWKVFDKEGLNTRGRIASLFRAAIYPKGKIIERSKGPTKYDVGRGLGSRSEHGLYFYTSKAEALAAAKSWPCTYIAKFAVDPADFMFADGHGQAVYQRAARVGNYIRVSK